MCVDCLKVVDAMRFAFFTFVSHFIKATLQQPLYGAKIKVTEGKL
jgi:hypothetical protein